MDVEQPLLFNQTKIFCKGEEIGYYNKSSFYKEILNFLELDKKSYYVICDFQTHQLSKNTKFIIDCLTCYDIDVLSNEIYKEYMPKPSICAFYSNSNYSLPAA